MTHRWRWLTWDVVSTVLIVAIVPFGWLYPLLRSAYRVIGRNFAPELASIRRRSR
jgi:hypothetical protein